MTEIRFLQTSMLVLMLTACGGGDTGTLTLIGRVATAGNESIRVCLDANKSLSCDEREPTTSVGDDGSFRLTLPASSKLDGQYLVAEFGAAPVFTLVAPAVNRVVIGGLTTVLSVSMLNPPNRLLANAASKVKSSLGLASSLDPFAGLDGPQNSALQKLEDAALDALRSGSQAYASSATASASKAVASSAPVVLRTLAKYIDPTTGHLYPTVTSKTVTAETVGSLNPVHCSIQPPPAIRIETEQRSPILSKDDYLLARVSMNATTDFPASFDLVTKIRGRGNSTWDMPKKPYRLKLDKKSALLGMAADKDWTLLANYADKTMLRNAVAMCLGKILAMDYVPAYRFVELTLNGDYQGVYQLSDQIEVSDDRVNIGVPAQDDADMDAGFLLEIDASLDDDLWFSSQMGVPYTVKSDATPRQGDNIRRFINGVEQAVFSDSYTDPETGYAQHIDVESLIDFYLINELMRNNDAFFSSTFVYRQRAGKLAFGPLWDFDIAAGNIDFNGNEETDGWWVRQQSIYVTRLLSDPAFVAHLKARWQYLRSRLPELQQFIDESAHTLDDAQRRNFQAWDILNTYVWPNAVVTGSYEGEIGYLKNWLDQRAVWMNRELAPPRQR